MKKILSTVFVTGALLGAVTTVAPAKAEARTHVSVSLGLPFFAPAVYVPPPRYAYRPAYYYDAYGYPVYYAPAPVAYRYYDGGPYRDHYRYYHGWH